MAQDTSLMSVDYHNTSITSLSDVSEATHFVLIGQNLRENEDLHRALQALGAEISYSDTGMDETLNDPDIAPIVENFEGSIFNTLLKHKTNIFAPPAIYKYANKKVFPLSIRPTYCLSMEGITICFNGFKNKSALQSVSFMVHSMNGIIKKDVVASVTHLVSLGTKGDKYKLAVSKGLPVMSVAWIEKCWELRNDPYLKAEDLSSLEYKLSPFVSSTLSFYGFSTEEEKHMKDITTANGGRVTTDQAASTHLVVNERKISSLPFSVAGSTHVVKSEWFWASIQIEALAIESLYPFEGSCHTPGRRTPSTPHSNSNKRKRGREVSTRFASEEEMSAPPGKRCSLDVLGQTPKVASLDDTSVEMTHDDDPPETPGHPETPPNLSMSASNLASLTKRQRIILELYDTENKFVSILDLIVNTIQPSVEKTNQPGGSLLSPQEVKNIFSGLTPIYKLHIAIKEKLLRVVSAWDRNHSVGEIFTAHADEILKIYPAFINFLNKTKEYVAMYEKKYPRFLAFLKVCQSKREFNREHFSELLIRPVQRLPSTKLLLEAILKQTEITNSDYLPLKKGIERLNNVIRIIDDGRRKTENYQIIFALNDEIENLPVTLISVHRILYMKVELNLVEGKGLGVDGDKLLMLIFDKTIEICKRWSPNNIRASTVSISQLTMGGKASNKDHAKPYVHVSKIHYSKIKRIVEVLGVKDYQSFSLVFDDKGKEAMYTFTISNKRPPRIEPTCGLKEDEDFDFLNFLTKIVGLSGRANNDDLLAAVNCENLSIDMSRFIKSGIIRTASKISKNFSRAFSQSKTPLKRTISQISNVLSPLRRDNSISVINTPTNQNESTRYSEFIDSMRQEGTPSMQRRRDTLATISTIENPQRSQADDTFIFATPLPVRSRKEGRTNQLAPINLGRDFPSMQLIQFDNEEQNENLQPDQTSNE